MSDVKPTAREDLAKECRKIEKSGGDVIAYLKGKGYIYSTQSTWVNLQRQCLKRSDGQITDGRPKDPKEAEEVRRKNWDSEKFLQIAEEAVRILKAGEDPRTYLQANGYTDLATAWKRVKQVYQEAHPEDDFEFTRLPPRNRVIGTYSAKAPDKHGNPYSPRKAPESVSASRTGERKAEAPEAPQRAKSGGKREDSGGYITPEEMAKQAVRVMSEKSGHSLTVDAREIARAAGERKTGVTTCCAPAKPSGVTVPDELPEEPRNSQVQPPEEKGNPDRPPEKAAKEGKKVRTIMVETELGTFKAEDGGIVFRRNDNDRDYNNTLRMLPEGWRQLMELMDEVLEVLDAAE